MGSGLLPLVWQAFPCNPFAVCQVRKTRRHQCLTEAQSQSTLNEQLKARAIAARSALNNALSSIILLHVPAGLTCA